MVTMCKDVRGGCTERGFCMEKQQAAVPLRVQDHKRIIEKPKQPSIIQQVQSEPAPEEKAWGWGGGVEMDSARESVHKHVMWSMFDDGAVCAANHTRVT